jgi:hypothetical protein
MNDMDRNLNGVALPSACLAADGSGAGAPRDDGPRRPGIELGDMLEMGLESLLMHFRRKPDAQVVSHDPLKPDRPEPSD